MENNLTISKYEENLENAEDSQTTNISNRPKGQAPIKKEFLTKERQRTIADKLPAAVADELSQKIESSRAENDKKGERLKGRNRNDQRPIFKAASHNLCVLAARGFEEEKCQFGLSCRFSHDLADYMSKREPDIGETCYPFEKYGRCRFGVLCRFGSSHIRDDGSNIVNEEKWSQFKDIPLTFNELTKELQVALRKRKINFPKTDQYSKNREEARSFVKDNEVSRNVGSEEPELKECSPPKKTDNGECCPNIEQEKSEPEVHRDSKDLEERSPAKKKKADNGECDTNIEQEKSEPEVHRDSKELEPNVGTDKYWDESSKERKFKVDKILRKPFLSPLTTVGNLPFRRICCEFGAQVTCGEMAMTSKLLQGHASEWALLRRHHSENCFGVQLCGGNPTMMARCAELISDRLNVDFIDVNAACPIALVCKKGEGASLMAKPVRLYNVVRAIRSASPIPISVKIRTGMSDSYTNRFAHEIVAGLVDAGADFVAIHGRTRDQRYTRHADWDYLNRCAEVGMEKSFPVFGVGDTLSFTDYYDHLENTKVSNVVIARGALIKPWIFTEIEEKQHLDISSNERFDMLRRYANYGLEHWGSDTKGVETTRRFLLEWQSFLYRYIPVGLLEVLPQKINERPPTYFGRNDLETLMASPNCGDWIKISEMLLGPVPENFTFLPKHKANAYH